MIVKANAFRTHEATLYIILHFIIVYHIMSKGQLLKYRTTLISEGTPINLVRLLSCNCGASAFALRASVDKTAARPHYSITALQFLSFTPSPSH